MVARRPAASRAKPAVKRKPVAKKKTPANKPKSAAIAVPSSSNEEGSVRIRKIDNGYIVSKETYGGRAGYKTTETFLPKKPKITVG